MSSFKSPPVVDINTARADSFVGGGGSLVSYEPDKAHSPLALIEKAEQALEKASTIDVVKGIRDQAEVLRLYAKQAQKSFEMQNQCAEIKLRAERKAGNMLMEQEKNKGAAVSTEDTWEIPKLKDLGISYSQSSRWQAIAGIPDQNFEQWMERIKTSGKEITSAEFIRLAKRLTKPDSNNNKEMPVDLVSEDFKLAVDTLRNAVVQARSSGWQKTSRSTAVALIKSLLTMVKA